VALVDVAIRESARRAYWAEQRRIAAEAERRRYEETEKIRKLEAEVTAWQKSRQLHAYIAATLPRSNERPSGPVPSRQAANWTSGCHGLARMRIESTRYMQIRSLRTRPLMTRRL
jgi:hypothetical protein